MKADLIKKHFFMFIVMVIIGMLFNPMNILAYRVSDLFFSLTLFYGGLLMASNMMWSHEIINLFLNNKMNTPIFLIGIILSFSISIFLLREQLFVDDKQWLKRMISHHSTALTTSHKIYKKTQNSELKKLAKEIINTQEREITEMKSML